MNARSFLGDEKIGALMQQGYSPEQITNYAKTEYYKQRGAQQANLTPQQEAAVLQKNVVLRPAPQQSENTDWAAQGYRPAEFKNETQAANYTPQAAAEILKHIGNGANTQIAAENSMRRDAQSKEADDKLYRDEYINRVIEPEHRLHRDVAKAQSQSLFKMIAGDEKDAKEVAEDLDYVARNAGYDLGAVRTDDGRIFFGAQAPDGRIIQKEVTPDMFDHLAANKGEIIGGVVGGGLAPFTGGASLVPMLAMSAGGSAIGSMNDLRQKGEAVGREYSAGDYAARALQAAGEDALGGVAVAGASKLIKAAAPAIKQAGEKVINPIAKKAASLADNSILANLARRVTTDNIEGAEAQYIKSMGGEAQTLKDLASTKNALGGEGFNQFSNADRSFQIPKTGSEAVDKGIGFANEKIIKPAEQTIKRVIQGENLSQREANLLASALSNDKGAKLILDSVASDANAFAKTQRVMQGLNSSFAKNIGEAFKDAPNAVQTLKEYAARTKGDFGNVIKTLDSEFSTAGIDTRTLSKNVSTALQDTLGNSRTTKHIMKAIERGGLDGLQDARSFINNEISAMKGANDALSRERILELGDARAIIDDAVNGALDQFSRINPRVGERAKALMETARNDYKAFKEVQESDLYKRLTGAMKDTNDLTSALIKSADNQTGKNLDEILSALNPAERANIEGSLLKNIVERNTKNGITDFGKAFEQIDKIPFKSQRVAGAVEELKQSAPLLKNSGEILKQLSEMAPKTAELQQGIGKSITGAFQVMLRNRLVNKLKSKIPWYGNNQALKNHIANALKNAGDLEGAIKNIEAIPTEGLDSATKEGLSKFTKEVIPEIRQILKTQNDEAVRAKFSPEELKKALIDPSLTTQEKVNLVERAKQQIKEEMGAKRPTIEDVLAAREKNPAIVANDAVVSGEGFTLKDGAAAKSDYNVKFKLAPNVRDLAKLQTDEISADLEYLANKHPEMFSGRPADVFRLIREIKENPTHFYANNRLDYGLIVKRLDGNKIGKLAVEKETGDIKHATKVNDKDLKRLEKISKEKLGDAGIIQTFTRPGSKLENQGLGYQTTDIIPQNSQKVKELPPAELRKAIINAKDDKERLAIIENQKAGIRQRLQREDAMKEKEALDRKLVERANENSQFNRGSATQRRLNQTLNEVDKLEISEAKKDAVRKKIISEAQKELRASADLIPANVSGAAGYNAKKADRQIDAVIKARENKEQILKRAGEKNSRFGSFKADIADSEFIKIGNHVTLSGKPRIAISFRTLPDASTKFALKKKGFFYDNSIGAWSIEPSKFDEKWISGRLSQLFNKDGATLDLKRAVAEDPFSALPKATATRLRAMKQHAAEKDTPDHLVGDEGWYSRYVTKYEKDRKTLERQLNIEPIKQFGTNYAEFYHDGQGAMKKLLAEREGQVAGAFYRKDLGDIDLIWGEAKQNAKEGWDGYGLAKIEKKHPEITAQILDDIIKNGELEKTHNGYNVKSGRYVIGLNRGWNENGVKIGDNKWIVTAFDDSKEKAISKAPVDSFDGRNAASANSMGIIPQNLKNASIGEWQREISKAGDDWKGLKRPMDQIKHSETLKQNERAGLYVDISERMKKIGK